MREDRKWSQKEFGRRAGMAQGRVSVLEDPDYGKPTITTLKRIASAFDVALVVRFGPFSELAELATNLSPEDLAVPDFAHDAGLQQTQAQPANYLCRRAFMGKAGAAVTDDELDRLDALAQAASPGPWTWALAESDGVTLRHPDMTPPGCLTVTDLESPTRWVASADAPAPITGLPPDENDGSTDGEFLVFQVFEPDAAFITASRTAVPKLIAEVRRLRGLVQSQQDAS
jgi:transcriptional regulator with XRE-family HTH domain